MKVEILHIDGCPNSQEAGRRLRTALDALGLHDVGIGYRLLNSSEDAAAVPFAGSPTILLDNADAFPSDGRTTDLACRIYATDQGLAGLPTVDQLIRAVQDRIHPVSFDLAPQ